MNRLMKFIKERTEITVVIAFFAALIFVVLQKAIAAPDGFTLLGLDISRYSIYQYQFIHNTLASGQMPFWNPYILNGLPFLESTKVQALYPPNWLLAVYPYPSSYPWYIAFHLLIALIGMYWLMRHVFSLDILPSFVASIAFGLSGFFGARIWAGHVEMVVTAAFIPIYFGSVVKLLSATTRKQIAGSYVRVALWGFLIYISGYQPIALLAYEGAAITAVIYGVFAMNGRIFLRFVFAMAIVFGLAAVQIIPNQRYLGYTVRNLPISYDWFAQGSLQWRFLAEAISPFIFGDQNAYFGSWWVPYHERAFYIGKLPMILAIASCVFVLLRRDKSAVRTAVVTFAVLCLWTLWVSLGANAPFDLYRVLTVVVPVYAKMRMPSRHMLLFTFAASALSAFGLQKLKSLPLRLVIIALVVADLVPYMRHFIDITKSPDALLDRQLSSELVAARSKGRVLVNYGIGSALSETMQINQPMSSGFYSTNGYETAQLENYFTFFDAMNGRIDSSITQFDSQVPILTNFRSPYFKLLGATYLLADTATDVVPASGVSELTLIRDIPDRNYRLYSVSKSLPRYFFVPSAVLLTNENEVAAAVRQGKYDPAKEVVLPYRKELKSNVFDCPDDYKGSVSTVSFGVNRVTLLVDASCNGMVTGSDVMYPSWQAYIDGNRVPLYEGNMAFRTLYMPKGRHTVELVYVPSIFAVGFAVSMITASIGYVLLRRYRTE